MRPASTARLMALFTAVAVASALAVYIVKILTFSLGFGRPPDVRGVLFFQLALFVIALAGGWFQARIIARHRRFLPSWALATALGSLAGSLLGFFTAREALSAVGPLSQGKLSPWIQMLTWSVTGSLCIGSALALSIWGRRWTTDTLQWLTGLMVVRLAAEAMPLLFREAAEPTKSVSFSTFVVIPLLSAALVGAGTAWLLDRIVFRVPAGQPFEPGARTVE